MKRKAEVIGSSVGVVGGAIAGTKVGAGMYATISKPRGEV